MSKIDLDEIMRVTNAATAGPWCARPGADPNYLWQVYVSSVGDGSIVESNHAADATFTAAAREWVPALVAWVRELQQQIADLEERAAYDYDIMRKEMADREWEAGYTGYLEGKAER